MESFNRIPAHIGVIPDGNRRWAVENGYQKQDGYVHGITPGFELYEMMLEYGVNVNEKVDQCSRKSLPLMTTNSLTTR